MIDLSYIISDMKTDTKQATTKDMENLLDEDYKETMNTIKWNGKEYKMPFNADYSRQKDDSFKEEIIVNNRFNNEPAMLPWFAVAVYDVIMGSEQTQDWDNHRKGLDWFIKYFPKQYSVLLD
jgi:hypothetical protein